MSSIHPYVIQTNVLDRSAGSDISKESNTVIRTVDDQVGNGVIPAIKGTDEPIRRNPNRIEPRTAIPARGLGGIDIVDQHVMRAQVRAHVLELGHVGDLVRIGC